VETAEANVFDTAARVDDDTGAETVAVGVVNGAAEAAEVEVEGDGVAVAVTGAGG
jgi:hypothetical protein